VLAAEHLLDLAGLHFFIERVERKSELAVHRLSGFRPFDQHGQIFALAPERLDEIAILLEAPSALERFLGFRLILPEIGRRSPRFEAVQLFFRVVGFKDSSGDRQRGG